ncbi:hypothetical protein C8R44DRAFT_365825 [Mycena epipterygia]|nr:hypothetical protein C8R44DRAFT_365825 [Mycena epipterygia]
MAGELRISTATLGSNSSTAPNMRKNSEPSTLRSSLEQHRDQQILHHHDQQRNREQQCAYYAQPAFRLHTSASARAHTWEWVDLSQVRCLSYRFCFLGSGFERTWFFEGRGLALYGVVWGQSFPFAACLFSALWGVFLGASSYGRLCETVLVLPTVLVSCAGCWCGIRGRFVVGWVPTSFLHPASTCSRVYFASRAGMRPPCDGAHRAPASACPRARTQTPSDSRSPISRVTLM